MSMGKVITFIGSIAVAIGAYGWWWNGEVGAVAQRYDAAFKRLLPEGSEVSYKKLEEGGFPFRIYHRLGDVHISVPDNGSWTLSSIEVFHQPWTKGHMVVRFAGDVSRLDNKEAAVWTITADKNLASLVGYDTSRAAFDLDMRDITLSSNDGVRDIPALRVHARTEGYFGDETTENKIITDSAPIPWMF